MALHGADTEQLDNLGASLQDGRGRIDSLQGRLNSRVSVVTSIAWHGTDADVFRSSWQSVSQTLDTLAERLQHVGSDLKEQAREQDRVSTSSASIFEPGGEGAADSGWGTAFGVGQGIYSTAMSGYAIFKNSRKTGQYVDNIGEMTELARHFPGLADQLYGDIADSVANPVTQHGDKARTALDWMGGKFGLDGTSLMNRADGLLEVLEHPAIQTGGRFLGGALSVFEIGSGLHQTFSAGSSNLERISGGLSTVSGVAGIVALTVPPLAPVAGAISAATGVASAVIDVGTSAVENWDTISATAGDVAQGIGDTIGGIGDAVGDGLASLF